MILETKLYLSLSAPYIRCTCCPSMCSIRIGPFLLAHQQVFSTKTLPFSVAMAWKPNGPGGVSIDLTARIVSLLCHVSFGRGTRHAQRNHDNLPIEKLNCSFQKKHVSISFCHHLFDDVLPQGCKLDHCIFLLEGEKGFSRTHPRPWR